MFCTQCGNTSEYGVSFCPRCGARQTPGGQRKNFATRVVGNVTDQVESAFGAKRHVNLEFSHFFSEVRKRHTKEEAEEIFIYGTPGTTPDIHDAGHLWRRPWLHSRVLAVLLLSFVGLLLIWLAFENINMLPGIMLLGAFAVPFSTLVFFYEMNAPRNISFLEMLEDFFMGGIASIAAVFPLLALILGSGTGSLSPAMLTELIEEMAKLVVIAFVMHQSDEGRYLLNGLLFGAAAGAGFASFESAGYAFTSLLAMGSDFDMLLNIALRALLAIGGHVAWAAVTGAVLSIALHRGPFSWKVFGRPEFWALFAIPVLCHGLWDWLSILVCVPLVVFIWIVLLVLIRRGFAEVNELARGES